jgi:hypothetical protein
MPSRTAHVSLGFRQSWSDLAGAADRTEGIRTHVPKCLQTPKEPRICRDAPGKNRTCARVLGNPCQGRARPRTLTVVLVIRVLRQCRDSSCQRQRAAFSSILPGTLPILAKADQSRRTASRLPNRKGPVSGAFFSGSDGTRTRDLRRDRSPERLTEPHRDACFPHGEPNLPKRVFERGARCGRASCHGIAKANRVLAVNGRKVAITENVLAGDLPRVVVFVGCGLTAETGCTMRSLRNARRLWASRVCQVPIP